MSDITRITRRDLPTRTSGTVLSEVRRPHRIAPEPPLDALTKAELVERAEAAGVDTSGNKADLVERLTDG